MEPTLRIGMQPLAVWLGGLVKEEVTRLIDKYDIADSTHSNLSFFSLYEGVKVSIEEITSTVDVVLKERQIHL
jgi:hypothetical protein